MKRRLEHWVMLYKLHVVRDPFTVDIRRWVADRGDATLRLDYDLKADAVVFDLGGYMGDFAEDIHERFGCSVYVFEPHPRYYQACVDRFKGNRKIRVFDFGIAERDGEFTLSDDADASSLVHAATTGLSVTCRVRMFSSVIRELGVSSIDLMKINIEGAKYGLLEHIADSGLIPLTCNYQVQFHQFVPNAAARRRKIAEALSITHDRTWCYEFVWENWRRRTAQPA